MSSEVLVVLTACAVGEVRVSTSRGCRRKRKICVSHCRVKMKTDEESPNTLQEPFQPGVNNAFHQMPPSRPSASSTRSCPPASLHQGTALPRAGPSSRRRGRAGGVDTAGPSSQLGGLRCCRAKGGSSWDPGKEEQGGDAEATGPDFPSTGLRRAESKWQVETLGGPS